MKNKITLLLASAILLLQLLMGCSLTKKSSRFRLEMDNDYCVSNGSQDFNLIKPFSYNVDSLITSDTLLKRKLSVNEILVANATGTISIISQLYVLRIDTSLGAAIKALEFKVQLQEQSFKIRSAFDEVLSYINCEEARTRRASGYLDIYEKKRTKNLTIGTIFAGAALTVVPIIIKDTKPQNITLIGGAILSAYLGAQLLHPGHNHVKFTSDQNYLSDIWYEPKVSRVYPDFIWQLLSRKELNQENDHLSIQQNIKKRWSKIELKDSDDKTVHLLFENGGIYSEDDLQTRVVLLDQLEASLRLLNTYTQSYMSSIESKLTD